MKCPKCGKEFENERAFSGHKGACFSEKVECPICKRMMFVGNLPPHLKAHSREHPCAHCGKIVAGPRRFCDHSCAASHKNKGIRRKGTPTPACLECGKPVKTYHQKFCSQDCSQKARWKKTKKRIEKDGGWSPRLFGNGTPRRYLLETKGHICWICENKEWMEKPIPLVVDHVNGNSEDWRIVNLRLVCGNCDMQLPTYKGRNSGKGRHYRKIRYREGKSF